PAPLADSASAVTFVPLFFFQAEDGIRDFHVTGVQTCALPISACRRRSRRWSAFRRSSTSCSAPRPRKAARPSWSRRRTSRLALRSEERRVGKECRTRATPHQPKENRGAERT